MCDSDPADCPSSAPNGQMWTVEVLIARMYPCSESVFHRILGIKNKACEESLPGQQLKDFMGTFSKHRHFQKEGSQEESRRLDAHG